MTSFQDLRQRRHAQWLTELKQQIQSIVESQAKPPQQIYLFGSRARGDWDGLSDTDLLVDGLPPASFLNAIALAEGAGPLPVDLKRQEDLSNDLV